MLNNMQTVKLFSRTFVANVKKDSLRCPKCLNEFSSTYDKSVGDCFAKSGRPFLLPCGHDICESCFNQNKQPNIICSVCLKPFDLSSNMQQTNQRYIKFSSCVRNYLDINFFLLGQLNHVKFYYKNDNISISEITSLSQSKSSSDKQCSECEEATAMGKCKSCQVYMCDDCFRRVHCIAKALKKHEWIPMHKIKENLNEYKLPNRKYCGSHNRIADRKCRKCRLICCDVCIQNEHKNHGWCTIQDVNNTILDQVDPLLETVNKIHDSVKKAQKEIQSIQSQLEKYAIKTLEDLSNFFLSAHNFLQNEEKRLTNEFMMLSQQTQNQLNQAFQKFAKSHEALNSMRNNLEIHRGTSPKDVFLRSILNAYRKQLQNMPCELNISAVQENPFRFEIHSDIFNDLPRCYATSFKDPDISISIKCLSETSNFINSDLNQTLNSIPECHNVAEPMDISISCDSPTLYNAPINKQNAISQYHRSQSSSKNSNNKMKRNKNNNCNNISNKNHNLVSRTKECNFFNDTTTEFELHNGSINHKSLLGAGEELVKVTYIKSPDNFYVQNINSFKQVKIISGLYNDDCYFYRKPQIINENHYYMIYHDQDKQWYRAMLEKILTNNLYQIYLVDFGIYMDITKDRICNIESEHLDIPFAALHCAINDLIPASGREWTENAKLFLMEILQNNPAYLRIIAKGADDLFIVDLRNNLTQSLRESFLYSGLALDGSANGSKNIKTITPDGLLQQPIPQHDFQFGEMLKVITSHVESPEEFYVIMNDTYQEWKDFASNINDYYHDKSIKHIQLYLGYPQKSCVVCLNDEWHRATIEEVKGNGKILVRFVDIGTSQTVSWRQAYALSNKFSNIKEYAIRCSLADIQPSQTDGYVYSANAINDFKQMVVNPNLRIEILGKEDNKYKVILFINRKMLDINVGASLVKNGHGISTGDATQIVQITKKQTILRRTKSLESDAEKNVQNSDNHLNVNEEVKTDKKLLQRSAILIAHIIDPGEFYVQLADLVSGVEIFHKTLQDIHNLKYKQSVDQEYYSQEWQLNDPCVVYIKYNRDIFANDKQNLSQQNAECTWYRGIIKSVTNPLNQMYDIFLRDIGVTLKAIPNNQIYPIDDQLNRVANVAYRCHLACIASSTTKRWSQTAISCFKAAIKKFDSLYVTKQGKTDPVTTSLPVVLWGLTIDYVGALSPCARNFVAINRILIKAGVAYMLGPLDVRQQLDFTEEISVYENEVTLMKWLEKYNDAFADIGVKNFNDKSKSILELDTSEIMYPKPEYSFEHDVNGLNIEPTTGQTTPPLAWLTNRPIDKTIFIGYPTYLDYHCSVYIQDTMDRTLAEKMIENLGRTYGIMPQPPSNYKYLVGQPCVATFKSTNLNKLYRCIVIQSHNKNKEWGLFYIDYGNIEHVLAEYMRPYAPYPHFPALVNKFRIKGIKPKGNAHKYSTEALDFMHGNLVGHHVTVRVIDTTSDNNVQSLRMCTIHSGSINIKDYAVNQGYVDVEDAEQTDVQDGDVMETLNFDDHSMNCDTFADQIDKTDQEEAFEILQDYMKQVAKKTNGAKNEIFNKHNISNNYRNNIKSNNNKKANNIYNDDETVLRQSTITTTTKPRIFNDLDYSNFLNEKLSTKSESVGQHTIDDGNNNGDDENDYENKNVELIEENFVKNWHNVEMLGDDNGDDIDNDIDNDNSNEINNCRVDRYKQSSGRHRKLINLNNNDHSMFEDFEPMLEEEQQITPKRYNFLRQLSRNNEKVKDVECSGVNTSSIYMDHEESDFDDFNPNATSSANTHMSCLRYFEEPHLPYGIKQFHCSVISVITPTILQIVPFNTEFLYRFRELMSAIKEMVKTLPLLETIKPGEKCLACYSRDNIWYRAVVCTYHGGSKMAQVMYVDYLNSETLPISKLKQLPEELMCYPLRTLRVRLHGVKCNPLVNNENIRFAMKRVLKKQRKYLAVIKKRRESASLDDKNVMTKKTYLPDFIDVGYNKNNQNTMEIVLYGTDTLSSNNSVVYKSLIDKKFFLKL